MSEELYVNANGFKCVRSQLAKTEGHDPQEYELYKKGYITKDKMEVREAQFAGRKSAIPERLQ